MRYFFYLYVLFLLIGTSLLIGYSKEELFLAVNSRHTDFSDLLFQVVTYLGDGIFAAIIVVILGLYRLRLGLIGLVGFASTGIAIQFLKKMVFPDAYRPMKYFEGIQDIYLIPGLNVHSYYSFPSGHTATAFGIFFLLTLVVCDFYNKKAKLFWGPAFCCLAIAVGYSRIYLAQHFLIDVLVGSAIGILIVWIVYHFGTSSYFSAPWLEKSVFNKK